MENRDTVGKISSDLLQKTPCSLDPIEIAQECTKEYIPNLIDAVQKNKNNYIGDFFIEVTLKREPLMLNVNRYLYRDRQSCPRPNYDQSVWKYDSKLEQIQYIWTIPDRETCFTLYVFRNEVVPEEQHSLQFVLDFADGTLYRKMKEFNNEEPDSNLLINNKSVLGYEGTK
jgi:hypothetical protein